MRSSSGFIQPFSGLTLSHVPFPSVAAGASTLGWMIQSRWERQRLEKFFGLSFFLPFYPRIPAGNFGIDLFKLNRNLDTDECVQEIGD